MPKFKADFPKYAAPPVPARAPAVASSSAKFPYPCNFGCGRKNVSSRPPPLGCCGLPACKKRAGY